MSSDSQWPEDPRLNGIIEEYLRRQDAGQSTDLESICRSYPDLADQLRAFLSDENAVRAASQDEEPDDRPTADRETIAPRRHTPSGKLVGETIAGRYRLMQVIGSGAMGCVYLAEDPSQKSKVAIKTPFFEGAHEKERKRRFRREAAALAAIRHPNICRVYEHGEHQGTPYLVMEYVEGPTLADLVSTPGIDPRQAAILCRGIAEGLVAAHAAGVVHRDLKPRNVLIDAATRRVVVTDFGLARFTDETETKLTLDGVVLGTPAYMPPEQVDGTWDQVGPRSDLYSLGIVLYELLTGQPPFTGRMAAVLGRIMRDKITPVRKIRSELDPEIDHICQTLTAKKPAERYPSARAVAAALTDYLANSDPAAKAEKRQATQLAAEREARRERVTALCRKGKYAEAATVLKEIRQWTGPGTEEYVRWATQEMERLRALPQKLRQDQSVLAETAQQLLAKHDYTSVVQLLQDVPPDYRSEAVQKLLDKAIDRQDEVDLLQVAIQDAVERRQFGGLEKALRRLLVLKPGYTPAQKMLSALREYQRRGIRDYKFSKSGVLLPPEGLGLLSGVRLAILVGALALLVTYWLVKIYLAGSQQGELAVTMAEMGQETPMNSKPLEALDELPDNTSEPSTMTPLPEDGPIGQFQVLKGHTQPIYALRFSRDGKYLISTSGDSTVRVWELATLTEKYSKPFANGGKEFAVSDNGRMVITNREGTYVLEIHTGEQIVKIPVPGQTAAISKDGSLVAVAKQDSPVTVWRIEGDRSFSKVCEFPRGSGEWASLNFIRNGTQIVCSSSEGHLIVYNSADGAVIRSNQGHPHRTNKCDFLLLSDDESKYICMDFGSKTLHNLSNDAQLDVYPDVHRMAFLPGNRYLAYLNRPASIQIYDTKSKSLSEKLPSQHLPANRTDGDYLAASPDGSYLATARAIFWEQQQHADTDNSIYLWRIPKEYCPEVTAPVLPTSSEKDDPERVAAEWVMSLGGKVGVHGLDRECIQSSDLPSGRLFLNTINLDYRSGITEQGLANLDRLSKLTVLTFNRTQLTDEGMAHIKDLESLCAFCAWETPISDSGLAHLKGLTNLSYLHLEYNPKISDAGLEHLKNMENLTNLYIGGTQVSDKGLIFIKGIKSLKSLSLRGTKVTLAGVTDLQKALPNCQIDYDSVPSTLPPSSENWESILGTNAVWKYKFVSPGAGLSWATQEADATWKSGEAPFGGEFVTRFNPRDRKREIVTVRPRKIAGMEAKTLWRTPEIWLRKQVTIPESYGDCQIKFRYIHDDGMTVYVNGKQVFDEPMSMTEYKARIMGAASSINLRPGRNEIAVHCVDQGPDGDATTSRIVDLQIDIIPERAK